MLLQNRILKLEKELKSNTRGDGGSTAPKRTQREESELMATDGGCRHSFLAAEEPVDSEFVGKMAVASEWHLPQIVEE
jgi:hypothetical protein